MRKKAFFVCPTRCIILVANSWIFQDFDFALLTSKKPHPIYQSNESVSQHGRRKDMHATIVAPSSCHVSSSITLLEASCGHEMVYEWHSLHTRQPKITGTRAMMNFVLYGVPHWRFSFIPFCSLDISIPRRPLPPPGFWASSAESIGIKM